MGLRRHAVPAGRQPTIVVDQAQAFCRHLGRGAVWYTVAESWQMFLATCIPVVIQVGFWKTKSSVFPQFGG
jgi:hypothetical protein